MTTPIESCTIFAFFHRFQLCRLVSIFLCISFTPVDVLCSDKFNSTTKPERTKLIKKNLDLAKETTRSDQRQSYEYALEAMEISEGFNAHLYAEATLQFAYMNTFLGELDVADSLLNQTIENLHQIENDTLLGLAYHLLGLNHQFNANNDFAIRFYLKAIETNEKLGLKEEMLKQLNNIGVIYRDENDYDNALKYLEKCLLLSKQISNTQMEFISYGNIGYIYMKQNRNKEALNRFNHVIDNADETNDLIALRVAYYLKADVKLQLKELKSADELARKALALSTKTGFQTGIIYSQRVLSEIYCNNKNYDKARELVQIALNITREHNIYMYYEDVLKALFKIEYQSGNLKKAIEVQSTIAERKDSLSRKKIKEKIANSEMQYQLLKEQQENEILRLENKQSNRQSIFSSIIAFLLLLLSIMAIVGYRFSRRYNQQLEISIAARTKDLKASNEELANFAFIASHDMKTPLLNIQNMISLIEKKYPEKNDKEAYYFKLIKKNAYQIYQLVQDTLEFSSFSAEKPKLELVDVEEIIKNIKHHYKQKDGKKVIVESGLPKLKARPGELNRILQNLIENGLKYNQSGFAVVKITYENQKHQHQFKIKDNGIGIEDAYLEHIFSMYKRLHNHSEYEGTGLGLALCRKLIRNNGGKIWAESKLDAGSTFYFTWPK